MSVRRGGFAPSRRRDRLGVHAQRTERLRRGDGGWGSGRPAARTAVGRPRRARTVPCPLPVAWRSAHHLHRGAPPGARDHQGGAGFGARRLDAGPRGPPGHGGRRGHDGESPGAHAGRMARRRRRRRLRRRAELHPSPLRPGRRARTDRRHAGQRHGMGAVSAVVGQRVPSRHRTGRRARARDRARCRHRRRRHPPDVTFGLIAVDRSTFARMPKETARWLGRCARANGVVER